MIRRALALAALVLLCTVAARAADPAAYLRVRTLYPTAQLRVWSSDDGKAWNPVCTSAPFAAKEAAGGEHPDYLFALDYLPAYLRFGVEGAFLGRLSVDFAEVLVGNTPRAPKELTPVGTVLDPDNLRARDDRPAILIHRGQPEVVDGFVLRLDPTPKPPSHAAKRCLFSTTSLGACALDLLICTCFLVVFAFNVLHHPHPPRPALRAATPGARAGQDARLD